MLVHLAAESFEEERSARARRLVCEHSRRFRHAGGWIGKRLHANVKAVTHSSSILACLIARTSPCLGMGVREPCSWPFGAKQAAAEKAATGLPHSMLAGGTISYLRPNSPAPI